MSNDSLTLHTTEGKRLQPCAVNHRVALKSELMIKNLLLLIFGLCYCVNAIAIEQMRLSLGKVTGPGWQAQGLTIVLDLSAADAEQFDLQLTIDRLSLPGLSQPLKTLQIHCPQLQQTATTIRCRKARLRLGPPFSAATTASADFSYGLLNQHLELQLQHLALAKGRLDLTARSRPTGWQATLTAQKLALDTLQTEIARLFNISDLPYTSTGELNFRLTASGKAQLQQAQFTAQLPNFSFSNSAGTHLGEKLGLQFSAQLSPQGQKAWNVALNLESAGGEVFIDPIYVDLSQQQLRFSSELMWQPTHLTVHQLQLSHPDVLLLNGGGQFQLGEQTTIKQLYATVNLPDLGRFYQVYLQNVLDSLGFKNLTLTGQFNAQLNKAQHTHVQAHLTDMSVENAAKSYGLADLNGHIQWHSDQNNQQYPSHLYWQSAYFANNLTLDSSQMHFNSRGSQFELLKPWFIPILDGALQINRLQAKHLDQPKQLAWSLSSRIWPVSMQALSTAFGGPPLQGQLAGDIPSIEYDSGHVEIGGELVIEVFDGTIRIQSLNLDDPLSKSPKMAADVVLERINLGTLTQVYAQFGAIEGELSGYVRNLRMLNWRPIAFDAFLSTPSNSTAPRRISQKAVNNLSSLGGGGTVNTISRGVLNLFENFSYERLGWGCRLSHRVCFMRGVESTPDGYYIVKGGGLPSINVIGYNQQVDWSVLLTRLQRIAKVKDISDPVIQ
jgi:hypothetical protein